MADVRQPRSVSVSLRGLLIRAASENPGRFCRGLPAFGQFVQRPILYRFRCAARPLLPMLSATGAIGRAFEDAKSSESQPSWHQQRARDLDRSASLGDRKLTFWATIRHLDRLRVHAALPAASPRDGDGRQYRPHRGFPRRCRSWAARARTSHFGSSAQISGRCTGQ